jgi:hypothetical protein
MVFVSDGIKMVIECLGDSEMDAVRSAAGTLLNLSVNDKNKVYPPTTRVGYYLLIFLQKEIVKYGGIGPLVRTIVNNDLEIRRFALRALVWFRFPPPLLHFHLRLIYHTVEFSSC